MGADALSQMQKQLNDPAVKQKMEEMMKDPAQRARIEQMQKDMANPLNQQFIKSGVELFQNKEWMNKMAGLKDDPALKDKFDELQKAIKTGGPAALMKYMNDEEFLTAISSRMGGAPSSMTNAAAAAAGERYLNQGTDAGEVAQAADAPPEITDLFQAANMGDVEAAEDFLAIGRDPNAVDKAGRTA